MCTVKRNDNKSSQIWFGTNKKRQVPACLFCGIHFLNVLFIPRLITSKKLND